MAQKKLRELKNLVPGKIIVLLEKKGQNPKISAKKTKDIVQKLDQAASMTDEEWRKKRRKKIFFET